MTAASLSISLGGSLPVALLLLFILCTAAVLFYRYTLPPLPVSKRIAFSILRALALSLLVLMLFEPVIRLVHVSDHLPAVAILVDNSQSMTIKDSTVERSEPVRAYLGRKHFEAIGGETALRFFTFSSKLKPAEERTLDSLRFDGEETNLADALVSLKNEESQQNIQAAVLITDGEYTVGKNPLYDAEALGIPVWTLGVGDTSEQKDLLVEKVIANDIAYAGTRVPIDATVKSSGFNGERVEVTLNDGKETIDRAMLTLEQGTREYPLKFHAEPKEEGTKRYTVAVSNLPGELVEKNNSKSIFMKVLRSKLRLVLFAGSPGPDVAAVRQVLAEDGRFTLQTFIQKKSGDFYEGTPSKSVLDSADCFLLIGFPSPATGSGVVRDIRDAVEQKKKPLLYISGKIVDYGKLQQLEPFLPFSWLSTGSQELNVFASVNEKEKSNSLVSFEEAGGADAWQQLPPVYKSATGFRIKPEADLLASARFQNVVLTEPLVSTRNINGIKSFAITGHGIWRWRLMAQGDSRTEKFLSLLLTNAVRWLTTEENAKGVHIVATKNSYTTTEPVEFTGQVYDDQLQPVENAEVKVTLQQGSNRLDVFLNPLGNGRYEGGTDGLSEGEYTFVGRATANGKSLGEDKGKLTVGQTSAEFLETRMNKPLLEEIAYKTGGRYHPISEASDIASEISKGVKFIPKELTEASEIELWNWQYLAGALILFLAVEWFMRKRAGML